MVTKAETPAERRSVQTAPLYEERPGASWVLNLATIADDIPEWGKDVVWRDRELRLFWRSEPVLASAIYTIVIRNAAFSWTLDGPKRTVAVVQRMLHQADLGKGWLHFITKMTLDLFTQDNGAFIEIIRQGKSATSPVLGIAHLDAGQCRRTGVREWPVIYRDRKGAEHRLGPHQVITIEEFPSPIETMNGMQLCAVSRVLRMAQLMRDISIHNREKVAGSNPKAVHIVSGPGRQELDDAMASHAYTQLERGYVRYLKPVILSTVDPTAVVSHTQIDLASLPDGFNLEEMMRWYINLLAMGFGADYQDFAPMPGRGLGSSTQSLVLHMKSRGKGPAMFMKTLEHKFNFHGIIPQNVTFSYDEQDIAEDFELSELREVRAKTHKLYFDMGVLTADAIRQQMLDKGDLDQELFDSLQEQEDITPNVTAHDEERVEKQAEGVSDFAEEERLEEEGSMERDITKAFREVFESLRKRILKGKAISFKQPGDIPDDARFWQEFRVVMVGAMNPHVRKGALKAAQFNADIGLAVDMDLVNSQVLDFSRTYLNDWWRALEETTRDGLRKAIVAWQETGLGKEGLPDLVDAIEPLFGKARASRIAITETTRIFDEGNKLAHISAGIETEEWQTSKDAHVCPICEPLDTNRYPTESGPRPVTDTHIGCRCARLPVVEDRAIQ